MLWASSIHYATTCINANMQLRTERALDLVAWMLIPRSGVQVWNLRATPSFEASFACVCFLGGGGGGCLESTSLSPRPGILANLVDASQA